MKRVAFHNLGCKVNSYELDIMRQKMAEAGYEVVPFDAEAEVYVINTCTVTNIADRKSRQMIHRARKRNPAAIVIAVGCYVETDPDRIGTDPAIDLAIGNNKKGQIAELLEEFLRERERKAPKASDDAGSGLQSGKKIICARNSGGTAETESVPGTAGTGNMSGTAQKQEGEDHLRRRTLGGVTMADLKHRPTYENMQLETPEHTRAYIKIQDGCNQFCSYCIIPYARGRIRSRAPHEIVNEITGLAGKGIKEVVLTGIHISSYGLEWGSETDAVSFDPDRAGRNLISLLQKIAAIPGISRIRLGSLEPRIITEEFVDGIAAIPQVCPHFHLSLQSGCNETLRRMNRHYTTEEFVEGVGLLRKAFDRPAITTDVIVGFAGETIAEFEQTEAFLREVKFYEMHVFKYSERHGTAAAGFPGRIPEAVRNYRSGRLLEMTREQAEDYRRSFLGQEEELLLEETVDLPEGRFWRGHTMRYVEGLISCDSGRTGSERSGNGGADPVQQLCQGSLVRGLFEKEGPGGALIMIPNDCTA